MEANEKSGFSDWVIKDWPVYLQIVQWWKDSCMYSKLNEGMSVYESFNQTLVEEDGEMWSSLDPEEKKAWISVYGLLLTVATTGNVLVSCFIVGKKKTMNYSFWFLDTRDQVKVNIFVTKVM